MAAEPFNSKSGYTVGIPPIPVIDANGNITANNALFGGSVVISGDGVFAGNITADVINGTFNGNISGNIVVPGNNTWVLFNNFGEAGSDGSFRYDKDTKIVYLEGTMVTDSIVYGNGVNEFCTTEISFATTNSSAPGQVLWTIPSNTICSVDFTIIATDTTGNVRQTSKLFATVLGDEVVYHEIGTVYVPIGPIGVADFTVNNESGDVHLLVQPTTDNLVTYKIMVTSYKE